MPFSLAYAILCICSIYLAIEKEKKNKRRHTQSKFGRRDCMSSVTTHK